MRKFIHGVLIPTLLCGLPAAALAQGGGTRGGGEVVDVNGTTELRDLIDQAACQSVRSGAQMMAENSEFGPILDKVKALDWYFADDVRKELESLRFCLVTAPIEPKDYRDEFKKKTGCVAKPSDDWADFVAFRHNKRVVVNLKRFNDPSAVPAPLSERSRALLLFHETLQSYLDIDPNWLCERRTKLWSMVRAISDVDLGVIATAEDLHLAMETNDLRFKTTVSQLDRYHYKTQLEFLLASPADRVTELLAATDINRLANIELSRIWDALNPWDQEALRRHPPEGVVADTIAETLLNGSLAQFKQLLAKPGSGEANPALIGRALFADFSDEKQAALPKSSDYGALLEGAYADMTQKRAPVISNGVGLRASLELQEKMGLEPKYDASLLQLNPYVGARRLSFEAEAVVEQIVWLVSRGFLDDLRTWVTENPDFYDAFGWKSQFVAIDGFIASGDVIPGEGPASQTALGVLRDQFVLRFLRRLEERLGASGYALIRPMFHDTEFTVK